MKAFKKKYQYWWDTGEGYALEEFNTLEELFILTCQYPSNNSYVTQSIDINTIHS